MREIILKDFVECMDCDSQLFSVLFNNVEMGFRFENVFDVFWYDDISFCFENECSKLTIFKSDITKILQCGNCVKVQIGENEMYITKESN